MRLTVLRPLAFAVLAGAVSVASATGQTTGQVAYVSSYYDNTVFRYTYNGTTFVKDNAFSITAANPNALTFGPDGNLYIASVTSNQILKFDVATQTTSTFLSSATLNAIAVANSGGAQTQYGPTSLAFGSGGTSLFLTRSGGQTDFSGTAGVDRLNLTAGSYNGTNAAIATGLFIPGGLGYDSASDTVYVGNTFGGGGISKVTSASSAAGIGNQSQFVAGGALNAPTGIVVSGNQVYVADSSFLNGPAGKVVRYINNAGTGTLDNTFSTGTELSNDFPQGLALLSGTLYVASQGNTQSPYPPGGGTGAVYTFDSLGNPVGSLAPNLYATSIAFQPVPEPAAVLAVSGLALGAVRLVRRRRAATTP
jgi:sugar lactone lactonase YvrE